jgi:hypothetical protein
MQHEYNQLKDLMLKIQELSEELQIADEILESLIEDEDFVLYEEEKKWIQKAIEKKGALHKQMKVKKGEKIPEKKLEKAAHKEGKLGKRARLALTLRKLSHKKKELKEATETSDEHDTLVDLLKANGHKMHPAEKERIESRIKHLRGQYYTNVVDSSY